MNRKKLIHSLCVGMLLMFCVSVGLAKTAEGYRSAACQVRQNEKCLAAIQNHNAQFTCATVDIVFGAPLWMKNSDFYNLPDQLPETKTCSKKALVWKTLVHLHSWCEKIECGPPKFK